MQVKLLTVFALTALASVHGIPQAIKRQAALSSTSTITVQPTNVPSIDSDATSAPPAFVNSDGTEDIAAIWAAFDEISPFIELPVQVSNTTVNVSPAAMDSIVAAQAADTINQAASEAGSDSSPDDDQSNSSNGSFSRRDLEKRVATSTNWAGYSTCGTQLSNPAGVPSQTNPDTVAGFQQNTYFSNAAKGAKAPVGYVLAQQNKQSTYQVANQNKGNYGLSAYDPSLCAAKCSAVKDCKSFTLYFERDPSIANPTASGQCSNPPSMTNIGCQLWSGYITSNSQMTEVGGYRTNSFRVALAGVNAYSVGSCTDGEPISGFTESTFPNGKIENQDVVGNILYTSVLSVDKFDPTYCQKIFNQFSTAVSFETWRAVRAGTEQGQGCIILSKGGYTSSQANDAGQWYTDSSGNNQYSSSAPVYYYQANLQ